MTGYGRVQGELDGMTVMVEIRCVNQRFLKIAVSLPDAWQGHQLRLENLVKEHLTRGTVILSVNRRGRPQGEAACHIDGQVVESYRRELQPFVAPGERVPLAMLLGLPGVLLPPENSRETEAQVVELLERLTREAVTAVVRTRKHEGAHLAEVLGENLDRIESLLTRIRQGVPVMLEGWSKRLHERIAELMSGSQATLQPGDLEREVAVFAERSDISEEIDRLTGHVGQFRTVLANDAAVGRQLEFLVQEMFREANTMGSKAGGLDLARLVLELKGEVDRLKEQVMNIE